MTTECNEKVKAFLQELDSVCVEHGLNISVNIDGRLMASELDGDESNFDIECVEDFTEGSESLNEFINNMQANQEKVDEVTQSLGDTGEYRQVITYRSLSGREVSIEGDLQEI